MKTTNRRTNRTVLGRPRGTRPQRRTPAAGHPLRRMRPAHRSPVRGSQGEAPARPGPAAPAVPERPREIPTIVEYSATKRPANYYPKRIISPPRPKTCCVRGMEDLGKPRREAGWFYVYKRCRTCGFTVRSIVRRDPAAAKLPVRVAFN